MKPPRLHGLDLQRISPLLMALFSLPAVALDVRLTFQLPRGMGYVEAGFSGFDNNRDGVIKSSDSEVVSAWSSLTENWEADHFSKIDKLISGNIDISYKYLDYLPNRDILYGDNEYFGLTRFIIETKRQDRGHINSSGVTFRLDGRHPFFSAFGFSWSEVYNSPSSFNYSFEGPINSVRLVLESSGNIIATSVPEPSTFILLLTGIILVIGVQAKPKRSSAEYASPATAPRPLY